MTKVFIEYYRGDNMLDSYPHVIELSDYDKRFSTVTVLFDQIWAARPSKEYTKFSMTLFQEDV